MAMVFLDTATKEKIECELEHADRTLAYLDKLARKWQNLSVTANELSAAQKQYDEDFLIRMVYNSNAIEGSSLTLVDTKAVWEGKSLPDKPEREQAAACGLFKGESLITEKISQGFPLDEKLLRDVHEACALDLPLSMRGMYRTTQALISDSRTTPTAPVKIRSEVANLFYQYEQEIDQTHPLVVVPWFHAAFENIHPFADGNGRTGRLWMNAQLQTCGYPPVCIPVDQSREYKSGLEAWQVDGDSVPFMRLFLRYMNDELEARIALVLCKESQIWHSA